jgi:hypothetical protein
MQFGRPIVIAFVLALAGSSAIAAEVTVEDVTFKLPPLAGFCDLEDQYPSDGRMLATLTDLLTKSGNKLLSMSADCQQLADWRAGKEPLLDDYANYQTPIRPIAETIKQTCDTLRAEGDKIQSNQTPDIKARLKDALPKIELKDASFMGVLAEDPTACYAGLLQKLRTETGADKTQVVLFAAMIVKKRFIFVYGITRYVDSDSVDRMLAVLKTHVPKVLAANQD